MSTPEMGDKCIYNLCPTQQTIKKHLIRATAHAANVTGDMS